MVFSQCLPHLNTLNCDVLPISIIFLNNLSYKQNNLKFKVTLHKALFFLLLFILNIKCPVLSKKKKKTMNGTYQKY